MKRLITLLILLAPTLGSADAPPCPDGCSFTMTQGSAIGQNGFGVEFSGGDGTTFTASGFGGVAGEVAVGTAGPIDVLFGGGGDDMAVHGTFLPSGPEFSSIDPMGFSSGLVRFEGTVLVTHAGRYTAPFSALIQLNCSAYMCGEDTFIDIEGTGLFTSTWVATGPCGETTCFEMTGQAHYIFGAPEPDTAPLLLLGFAGLALFARRWPEHTLGI